MKELEKHLKTAVDKLAEYDAKMEPITGKKRKVEKSSSSKKK